MNTTTDRASDAVHIMPNDGKHEVSSACPCGPVEDEQTKRLRAQGFPSMKVWVHRRLS